ncbi:hypothetical protein LIER_34293 [Lithospermum erythrorhizon]|uniref:Endonuclease/exonuclease/phosphatase domain-containing protein n=1 Tax=Lithospermum erythrorhizon TaxID=34254 RepID=A0AAV3S222_LITER
MKLTFVAPEMVEGKPMVRYKLIDILPGVNRWSSAAYGWALDVFQASFHPTSMGMFGHSDEYSRFGGNKAKPVVRKEWQMKVAKQHISVFNAFDALEEKGEVSEEQEEPLGIKKMNHLSQIIPNVNKKKVAKLQNGASGSIKEGDKFFLNVIYGRNDKDERKRLWSCLRQDKRRVGNLPWIIGGDFNVVRSNNESLEGNPLDGDTMEDLNGCLHDCELVDHPHEGCFYTWCRNWETQSLLRVLDRVVCNMKWMQLMIHCAVKITPAIDSDHYPLVVKVYEQLPGDPKPFKYQKFLKKHHSFQIP